MLEAREGIKSASGRWRPRQATCHDHEEIEPPRVLRRLMTPSISSNGASGKPGEVHFMVWNVTKDGVRTRMAVPNPEYYPTPPLQEKKITAGGDRYQTPEWILDGFPDEVDAVATQIYTDFNEENGTDYEFHLK
jgi:hypothetical protein